MLSDIKLYQILSKILTTCLIFANYMETLSNSLSTDAGDGEDEDEGKGKSWRPSDDEEIGERKSKKSGARMEVYSDHVKNVSFDENFIRTIQKFDSNFNKHLKELLDCLQIFSQTAPNVDLKRFQDRLYYNRIYFIKHQDLEFGFN